LTSPTCPWRSIAGGEGQAPKLTRYRILHFVQEAFKDDSVPAFGLSATNERTEPEALSLGLQ
jgi:hypothetical protein